MNYAKASQKLVDLLNLRGKPVAVSLLKQEEDIPHGLEEVSNPERYCQMLQKARLNEITSFATIDKHACKGGAAAVGLQDYPDKLKSGKLYVDKLGKEVSYSVAKRVVENMPRPEPGSTIATVISPLDNTATRPDVIIVIGNTLVARRIAQTIIYKHGGRMTADFAGIQSTCADATGSPYITGEVNISIGCDGAAKNAGLKDDEMVVGIPEEILGDVVNVLDMKAYEWDKWMKS
ncbi:DUF169 domain-containing protein [Methanohalobium sp.]|uniref:DUF169 domain-containing protein n=1 Tax=Methanohalobium sp. TaxID=2837493 RepID=UPI0025D92E1A|nr:DUF169 domain-containing protein [Methanohalobium sp.]